MRLADAYRRLHPRTSGSDDSAIYSLEVIFSCDAIDATYEVDFFTTRERPRYCVRSRRREACSCVAGVAAGDAREGSP